MTYLIGVITGWMVGGLFVALLRIAKKTAPTAHTHAFRPIAAQAEPLGLGMATTVLCRCECGSHVTNVYAGTWTLQDFLRTGTEVEELQRMVKL